MILRKWEVRPLDKERAAAFAQTYGVPFFLAMLMNIRGLDDAAHLREFLGEGEPLSDPFLLKDMDKAAARITRAVDNMEKIAVYGDYDADGVTSTAMLYSYLETRGADVIFYIPQREGEGYGMNMGAVEYLKEQGVSLIVTVDNGISSVQEVARANELGIDVVVTDHHRPQEILPDAVAVVDAYRPDDTSPYKHFSGVGIAFKLLMALEDGAGDVEDLLEAYSDLAAIGTIGDIVPLTGENRTLIRAGLERLSQSDRPGVQALLENAGIAGKALTSTNVAFTLVPRINATGRMGAPERAVRLLISGYEEEAEVLSEEICADNEERRRVEAEIAEAAFADIEAKGYMKDRVVVVDGENWHHGVIGIVASRVTERCGKPCMIISRGETEAKGSGRSIEGFSLFEAICACGDLLIKFGGHPMAAGITLKPENIEAFRKRINQYAAEHFPQMPTQTVTLDCKLNPAALSVSMAQSLTQLEPFGNGNPQPVFGLFNMELSNVTPVGGGGHLRLTLEKNGAVITAMRFNTKPEELPYHIGDKIDLAVQLEAREFRGQPSLTVIVRDMKFAAFNTEKNIASLASFEKWQRGEVLSAEDKNRLYPDRACLAAIYRALRTVNGKETDQVRFVSQFGKDMTLGLFKTALLVFEERGLVHSEIADDTFTATLIETSGKTDITRSPVLLALQ
ncbi:MAG: single-stranded-DNA-specific exonuclease RecJ [Firmicutes bacterium]|jgi:single-stranded-DNA-specific exonuclease recJ|uniref:single-stranded-DNA-specific exonuclease RecJ n=1 Tax=Hominenteromicrobium sp. TaxID=3073581 RepID=UPI002A588434|nr:single-stranded-DNA-specific exonuclease RecJ [Bacillota bacterium]MDD7399404.1 single-stranded-DNA-specific exonuclease RecJ [Bacillota bacterium]MDY4938561.1 single-stranded-DNA-specific exonuclease RecJ [Oscillospiraceae bacterium]